jgi:hypothetical protein
MCVELIFVLILCTIVRIHIHHWSAGAREAFGGDRSELQPRRVKVLCANSCLHAVIVDVSVHYSSQSCHLRSVHSSSLGAIFKKDDEEIRELTSNEYLWLMRDWAPLANFAQLEVLS